MDRTASYREVLAHRTTRLLWAAGGVSVLGDFVGAGALLLLAFDRSGQQAVGAAALFAATAIGGLTVAVFGGPLLDRISRKHGLVGGQLVGGLALLLPLLVHTLWPIYVSAVVIGAVRGATAALRQGALADGVPDDLRMGLVAMLGVNDQFAQVIGYAMGTGFAVIIGPAVALWLDLGSFLIGAVLLAWAPLPGRPAVVESPSLTRGWSTIFSHPHLRLLALLVMVTATTTAMPESLAVVAAGDATGWIPAIIAAGPAGTGIGYLISGRLRTTGTFDGQLVHLTIFGMAMLLALGATSPALWVGVNLLVGLGSAWVIGPQVTFIRLAPNERMAQVTASMFAIVIAAEGLGSLGLGALSDLTSPSTAYVTAGAVVLAAAISGWVARARRERLGIEVATGGSGPVPPVDQPWTSSN